MKALLHGGPLADSWWEVGGAPPTVLVPQVAVPQTPPTPDREMVLVGDFPVAPQAYRYSLQHQDGNAVYGWEREMRPEFEHVAEFRDGRAGGVRISMLGLASAFPFIRLTRKTPVEGAEWVQLEWTAPPCPDEVLYELANVLILPRPHCAQPQALYRVRAPLPLIPERTRP